jgi:hypothetical protein
MLLGFSTAKQGRSPSPLHLDPPRIVHQEVGALEVAVDDGGPAGMEVQHAAGSAQHLKGKRHIRQGQGMHTTFHLTVQVLVPRNQWL